MMPFRDIRPSDWGVEWFVICDNVPERLCQVESAHLQTEADRRLRVANDGSGGAFAALVSGAMITGRRHSCC